MPRTRDIKKNNGAGRPSKYDSRFDDIVYKQCSIHGATDKQLAETLGISEVTLNHWKWEHEKFFKSIKRGRDEFDTRVVERTLLKRALGYDYVEQRVETVEVDGYAVDENGNYIMNGKKRIKTKAPAVKYIKTDKHVLPDTGALCFWLKNRNPERWKDRKAVEMTGKDGTPLKQNVLLYIPDNDRGDVIDLNATDDEGRYISHNEGTA